MGEASRAVGVVVRGVQAGGGRRKGLCQLRTSASSGEELVAGDFPPARLRPPSTYLSSLPPAPSPARHPLGCTPAAWQVGWREGSREQSALVVSGHGVPPNKSLKLTPERPGGSGEAVCRGSLRAGESAAQLNSMLCLPEFGHHLVQSVHVLCARCRRPNCGTA